MNKNKRWLLTSLCVLSANVISAPIFASEESILPADTGLATSLRQQIASDCYGFVNHSAGNVRGYGVDSTFQLLRDGYPWANFDFSGMSIVDNEEVLVGGPGGACYFSTPGGLLNLVTRRPLGKDVVQERLVSEINQFGTLSTSFEKASQLSDNLSLRVGVSQSADRNAADNTDHTKGVSWNIDYRPDADVLFRWDVEYTNYFGPSGLGAIAFESLPPKYNRYQDRTQTWADYRFKQWAQLLALEYTINSDTEAKIGFSKVRYNSQFEDLYLEPQIGSDPLLIGFYYPDYASSFTAWQAELNHRFSYLDTHHFLTLRHASIDVTVPDQNYPAQTLGTFVAGKNYPRTINLPVIAERTLHSSEQRTTIQDRVTWHDFIANIGLQHTKLTDDNETNKQSVSKWLPATSITYAFNNEWSFLASKSKGATGRQFASLSSDNEDRIQGVGLSEETEFGLRYQDTQFKLGLGKFNIKKPYQFNLQNISIWRGAQHHQGYESTMQWNNELDTTHIVLTAQWLNAKVIGTGDPFLDGKIPPGTAKRRANLFLDYQTDKSSAWTWSVSAETVSSRPTFDDNQVLAPGYSTWDIGLEYKNKWGSYDVSTQFLLNNVFDTYAWSAASGGYVYANSPRQFGVVFNVYK